MYVCKQITINQNRAETEQSFKSQQSKVENIDFPSYDRREKKRKEVCFLQQPALLAIFFPFCLNRPMPSSNPSSRALLQDRPS